MITITKEVIEKVKADMKKEKAAARAVVSRVKEAAKARRIKLSELSQRDVKTIEEAETIISIFGSARCIPVRLHGTLVNYHTLDLLAKKLKGFDIKATFEEDTTGEKLVLWYTKGNSSGRFELYAMNEVFGRIHIPEATFDKRVQWL